jgi:hypothetical protein
VKSVGCNIVKAASQPATSQPATEGGKETT